MEPQLGWGLRTPLLLEVKMTEDKNSFTRWTRESNPDYRPRLVVDLREDQRLRMTRLIPWGLVGHLFRQVVDDVLDLVEKLGPAAFLLILRKLMPDKEYLSISKEVRLDGNTGESEEKRQGNER